MSAEEDDIGPEGDYSFLIEEFINFYAHALGIPIETLTALAGLCPTGQGEDLALGTLYHAMNRETFAAEE